MTPADVITGARWLIQDVKSVQRYSDALLLGFVNDTIKRVAVLRPDLFATIADLPTQDGELVQSAPADSLRMMEVFHVKGGGGVTEVDRKAMDQNYPNWYSDSEAPCINWMRHVRNPNRFFIYPKAPPGQVLVIEYAATPRDYAANEDIEMLPEAFRPVLIDGVVFLAQSVDDEHVTSQRAQLFQQSFTQSLSASVQSRVITDTKHSGMPPEDVV